MNYQKNIIKFEEFNSERNSMKKEFNSEPVQNEREYLEAKIKSYNGNIMEKLEQIFTIEKYQKNIINLLVYQ